jgi:hypothetical protein
LLTEIDQKGFTPGWFLDTISVTHIITGQEVLFHCYKWLDKQQDDGQVIRDLYPLGINQDGNTVLSVTDANGSQNCTLYYLHIF